MFQLLFLAHGMGCGARAANDPAWWSDVLESLKTSAGTYNHRANLVTASPKHGDVLVVPITYHDCFDAQRSAWAQTDPDEAAWLPLVEQLAFSDPAIKVRVPGWVQSAGEFFWTHALDVLLYRFVPAGFTTPIRVRIAKVIAQAWLKADQANGASTPVHFVAHSLGTAILHDSLSFLGSGHGAVPGFDANTRAITSVVTLANVSSVLEMDFPAYDSPDRPRAATPPPDGICDAQFSFRHELDPVVAVKTFRGDLNGWPPIGYTDKVLAEVKDWNVHGFTHYLNDPLAHLRLFSRLWPEEPWAARQAQAVANYHGVPGTPCPTAIGDARAKLIGIRDTPRPQNAAGLLAVVADVVKALGDAKAACDSEQGIP